MPLTTISIPAATAVVNYDMLQTRQDVAIAGRARVIRGLSLTGSAAIGDARVQVKVGSNVVATLYNSALAFPTADGTSFATQYKVPASSPISIVVDDAPATNPLVVLIDV